MSKCPIIIKNFNKRWFFGLIEINYHVEDRRPDIFEEKYDMYKHYLDVRVFFTKYNWTFRTSSKYEDLPYVKKNK